MKIFLNHAESDRPLADELARHLESAGFEVWQEGQLEPGDNWAAKTGDALKTSDAMVVLVSEAAATSPNVRRSIEYALSSPRYRNRLIPVLVEQTNDVPWILRRLQYVRALKDSAETSRRIASRLHEAAGVAD